MPIYEFYCTDCHALFNFRSPRIDTSKRPHCPRCDRPDLERKVSMFAVSTGKKDSDGSGDDPLAGIDESRMEQAMAGLASEMDGIDENDPRAAAQVMRKLYDASGLELGGGMEEALRRMEAGEDPESIENDLGAQLEGEEPKARLAELRRRSRPPQVDDRLYDL